MSSFEIGASRPVGAVQTQTTLQPTGNSPATTVAAPSSAVSSGTPQVQTSLTTNAGTVPVDQSRVSQIRQAVENGTYPIYPAKITDSIIAAGVMMQKVK